MRAVLASPCGVSVGEVPTPETPPDWVRVAVSACGVCRSDLHLARGGTLPPGVSWPIRPGHEVAGVVVESRDPAALAPQTPVVLHPLRSCGACPACRAGAEQRCRGARVLGIDDAGGMAEEVVWPAGRAVAVPGLPLDQAAVLPDAVATAHHALRLAAVPDGGTLAVIGAGGVGTHVLELARVLQPSVRPVAVARSEATAERLREAGVDVVRPLEGAGRAVRDRYGPIEAAVDFSGSPLAPAEGVRMLAPGGRLVLGSIVDEPVALGLPMTGLVTREVSVLGCYASTLADLRTVAGLATAGRLDLAASVSTRFPLGEAASAFDLLDKEPGGLVRVVLEPGGG